MVETPKDPVPFTQMTRCPVCDGTGIQKCDTCKGRGWKQKLNGYSLIPCPMCNGSKVTICLSCKGKLRLPEWENDGEHWMKKKITGGFKG